MPRPLGWMGQPCALMRTVTTAPQARLSRQARLSQLQGVFSLAPDARAGLEGRRLALVDDVMTTGASARAATRVLRQAGVASVIAKWQAKSGHKTHVIKNIKHDKMKITFYYRGELVRNKYVFVIKSLLAIRNYDLIHLHDAWFIVPFAKIMYPKKKFVMHYHGSLVRMNPIKKRAQWEKKVDAIIVATPDLLDYQYAKKPTYVPNPIDTDLFKKTSKKGTGHTNRIFKMITCLIYRKPIPITSNNITSRRFMWMPLKQIF